MWPNLFGPGSGMGLFVAGCIMALTGVILSLATRSVRPGGADPVADLWRRYEQGDLTSWEADRLFVELARRRAAKERAAIDREPVDLARVRYGHRGL